ncbi:hypothetical protein HNY73_003973 [Argiope bruennichi]|uniref:Uncharacterized protein n=1 Tax=Argiope bruennichi TaxID=94029 RepID=A0A8T0FS97_ARGBR|nr:hypothetical protein HNY73_003973 [Argiope bruennichi]
MVFLIDKRDRVASRGVVCGGREYDGKSWWCCKCGGEGYRASRGGVGLVRRDLVAILVVFCSGEEKGYGGKSWCVVEDRYMCGESWCVVRSLILCGKSWCVVRDGNIVFGKSWCVDEGEKRGSVWWQVVVCSEDGICVVGKSWCVVRKSYMCVWQFVLCMRAGYCVAIRGVSGSTVPQSRFIFQARNRFHHSKQQKKLFLDDIKLLNDQAMICYCKDSSAKIELMSAILQD